MKELENDESFSFGNHYSVACLDANGCIGH